MRKVLDRTICFRNQMIVAKNGENHIPKYYAQGQISSLSPSSFPNVTQSSSFRYPLATDCPDDQRAVNPEAEDEPWHSNPYPLQNYYFPDFSRANCGFGWDYPAWMGYNSYEKHYLFMNGEECCSKYFPTAGNCPYENEVQQDYYWTNYESNSECMLTLRTELIACTYSYPSFHLDINNTSIQS